MATEKIQVLVTVDGEEKLKRLKSEFAGAEVGAKNLEGQLSKNQKAIAGFTKAVGLAGATIATALVANGIRRAIQINREFEKSLSTLSSITGATGKDLEGLAKAARDIGKSTTLSARQAVEGFKLIGSARPELLKNQAALIAVTESAATLAEAAGLELPEAASALTNALNQFNIPANQAREVIDALANGSLRGAAAIPEVSEALTRVGAVASSNNVSLNQTVSLIEVLADKAITGAEAGTSLRNAILILSQDTRNFTDGAFDLEKALTNLNEDYESGADLLKQFGRENVTVATVLATNKDRYDELLPLIGEYGTAANQAAINTDNLDGDIDRLNSSLENLALNLNEGGVLSQGLRSLTQGFTNFIDNVANSFLFLDEYARKTAQVQEAVKGLTEEQEAQAQLYAEGFNEEILISELERYTEALDDTNSKQLTLAASQLASGNAISALQLLTKDLSGANQEAAEKAALYARALEIQRQRAAEAGESTEELDDAIENINKTLGEAAAPEGSIDAYNKKLEELNKQLRLATDPAIRNELRAQIESVSEVVDNLAISDKEINPEILGERTKKAGQAIADGIKEGFITAEGLEGGEVITTLFGVDPETGELSEETQEKVDQAVSAVNDIANNLTQARNRKELNDLNEKFNREIELAGSNEEAKSKIQERAERERVRLEKQQQRRSILITTSLNAVKALGLPPTPGLNFGAAASALAFGGLQAALVGGFKKGGFTDTDASNSTAVGFVHANEYVANADNTRKFKPMLEAMERGTLDPKIVNQLAMQPASINTTTEKVTNNIYMDKNGFSHWIERSGNRTRNLNARYYGRG